MLAELLFEVFHLRLEVGHIHLPVLCQDKLLLIFQGTLRCLHQQRDERHEELRANDIHLRIDVALVHDAAIIQLVVSLQQAHQHGILTSFLPPVLVQLLQEVLVFMLSGSGFHFVLHLEHDRDVFRPVFTVTEDEVALRTVARIIVLVKVSIRHQRTQITLELNTTMLLQGLTHHLRRHLRLQVLVVVYLFLLHTQLILMLLLQVCLMQLCLALLLLYLTLQFHDLVFSFLHISLCFVALLHQCQLQFVSILADL